MQKYLCAHDRNIANFPLAHVQISSGLLFLFPSSYLFAGLVVQTTRKPYDEAGKVAPHSSLEGPGT